MKKTSLFIIILIAIPLVMLISYVAYQPSRAWFDSVFENITPWIATNFAYASETFQTLPYWQWIGVGLVVLVTILIDRKAHAIWQGMQRWGYRKTTQPLYRTDPTAEPPQTIKPKPKTAPLKPLPPIEQETELAK